MTARFRGDYRGIGEMICGLEMQAEMIRRAARVAAAAEADAPVGPAGDPHRGRYKAAFTVEGGVREHKTRRAYGRVTNDSPEAVYVEYGNKNTDAHHTLGRALDGGEGLTVADVEALLIPWLASLVSARTVTELPATLATLAPVVQVVRIGGGSDDDVPSFDLPTVSVDCSTVGRAAALALATAVDVAVRVTLPGTSHTIGGRPTVVTKTQTVTGPSWRPYDDITIRRFGATYRLHIRT